jgi:uncharacterized protein YukE
MKTSANSGHVDALRRHCDDLQRGYDDLRARLEAIQCTVDRLRGLSEGDAPKRFADLSATWKRETRLISNVTKKAIHPAYQQIIALGDSAVPLILQDLATNGPEDWFWALTTITGDNPITEDSAGNMRAMAEAWLKWGLAKGYLNGSVQTMKQTSPACSESDIE